MGGGGNKISNLSPIQNSLNCPWGGFVENIIDFFQNLAHLLPKMVSGIASHSISGRLTVGYLGSYLHNHRSLYLEKTLQICFT